MVAVAVGQTLAMGLGRVDRAVAVLETLVVTAQQVLITRAVAAAVHPARAALAVAA